MSGMKEVLKDAVLLVLPSLSPDVTNQLVEKLMDQGVEGLDDLVYVKEDDILEFIRPIQCRKLLSSWKNQEHQNCTVVLPPAEVLPSVPPETNTTLGSPPSSSSRPTSSSLASASVTHSWTENFQVPWSLMPDGIKSAVENGQRPSPSDRRQMIRILADEMRKHDKNPTRSQCLTVSRKIVSQYPKSFADMLGDKQVGGGYESVLSQLKVRIEHLNRTNTLSHHRIQRSDTGTTRKRSSTDSYGCTRWQPDLPPRETYDSLEVKRQKMEEMHLHEGISGAERGDVCKLMEETYWLQRHMINATPSPTIADIKTKWPYLFTQRHIYGHFEQLTDKKVLRCLELSIQECGQIIIEFFKSKPTNDDIRSILSRGENDVDAMVIQLLLAHFKEKLDGVFLQADEFATPSDVQHSLNLPESPRLIFLGQSLSNQRWMLSLEGQVVCEGAQPNFITGLAALFASFYNFNLQYQEEAACTLEFVQRRFVDINPERGSKAKKGKVTSKKTGQVVQKKNATALKKKILLKGKKIGMESESPTGEVSDEDEAAEMNKDSLASESPSTDGKKSKHNLCKELSDLMFCKSVHFHSFEHSRMSANPDEMSSFSESKARKYSKEAGSDFVLHNTRQLTRVYPSGMRTDSSNYCPVDMWNMGCQIVALNFQTAGMEMDLNDGLFTQNGRSGYILKPEILRKKERLFDPENPEEHEDHHPLLFSVKVISGQQLPKVKQKDWSIVDPLVRVEIHGVPLDQAKQETKYIDNNGFNPRWNESLQFTIHTPELALVRFVVEDYDTTSRNDFIGQYTLPFTCIQPGYRHVHLLSKDGTSIHPSSIYVHIKITQL